MARINTYNLRIAVGRPVDVVAIDHKGENCDEFYVQFRVLDILQDEHGIHYAVDLVDRKFFLQRYRFQSEEDVGRYIGSDLEMVGVPEPAQKWVIQRVSSFARSLTNQSGVIPIKIYLWQKEDHIDAMYVDEDVMNNATEASMQESNARVVPATEVSIEALEKVRLGDEGFYDVSEGVCVICMEKLSNTWEVTRMPCLHVYHGDCITHWLKTSHLCPLCRFPMPSE